MAGESVCVYCRRHRAEPRWRPFCSERCKMADLGRWLTGGYSIAGPARETEAPDDDTHERAETAEDDETPPL